MKINKLVPVAGFVGVVAIVTPLLTSCSKYGFTYANDDLNVKDLNLKTKQLEQAPKSGKETDVYMQDIYNDHQILADDIAYSIHNNYWSKGRFDSLELSIKLSDNPNIQNHSISLELKLVGNEADAEENGTRTMSMSCSIRNAVVEMSKENGIWQIIPTFFLAKSEENAIKILKDNNSSVTWSQTIEDKTGSISTVKKLGNSHYDKKYIEDWEAAYLYLVTDSWYFAKI